ncbi:22937_t:CDS:2, partial [Racocetra persica]
NDFFYSDKLDFVKAQKFKKKYHDALSLITEYNYLGLKIINTEKKYQELISIAAFLKITLHPTKSNLPFIMEEIEEKIKCWLCFSNKIKLSFIETDLFYQYLASKTSSFDEEELINILNNEEPKHLFQVDNTTLYERDNDDEINKRAFEISKKDNIHKKINEIIQKIQNRKVLWW